MVGVYRSADVVDEVEDCAHGVGLRDGGEVDRPDRHADGHAPGEGGAGALPLDRGGGGVGARGGGRRDVELDQEGLGLGGRDEGA